MAIDFDEAEAADSLPFEAWRAQYMAVEGLGV